MKTTVTKTMTFEAAHRLHLHEGKCRNIHGHNYVVHVEVTYGLNATTNDTTGMVIDFSDLKEAMRHVEEALDHALILDRSDDILSRMKSIIQDFGLKTYVTLAPPTAEHLAEVIGRSVDGLLRKKDPDVRVVSVTVEETCDSKATIRWPLLCAGDACWSGA